MRKTFYILSVMLLLLCASLYAKSDEVYLRFQPDSFEDLKKLTNVVSIDNIEDGWVYAYANSRELSEFEGYGLPYELLPHPNSLIEVPMTSDKSGMKDWDSYPTYDTYVSMMNQFESDYPDLCEIVNVGLSEEGRDILFARISDNVSVEEDEPGVMYTATMHGDELAGYVLTLRLIDYLLSNYGTDSLATRLVDSCEIWINPLANPDGTYAGGNHTVNNSTRYNSNGYDINRNFPDPDGPISNPNGPWQAETVAMMDFAEDYTLAISANIHGGAEVVNYPWDTWSRRHVDDLWYIDISRAYADSAQFYSPSGYLTDLNNGITNGYDWYTTSGNRQDYMNYWHHCREVTLELSGVKKLPASQLPAHWTYNKASFLNWFENALYGIRGVITDAGTGLPLYAMVEVINYDEDQDSSQVYTDPEVGDYHRMLQAGTYDLIFSAPGYYPDTIFSIAVSQFDAVRHDVQLQPLPNEPILQFAGHNSGPVDPGDTVGFNITLENSGAGISYNTVGTLFTSDPYLTVTQNSSTYPDIGALGGTEISNSQYEFAVDLSCPLEYSAPLQLEVTADGGYIDTLTFSVMIGLQIEDFESGDFATFPWEFGGSADWTITASDVYEGSYSAKSGSISDNQSSSLILTADVISSGQISFFYKVSSESGYDYLSFYIDGLLQDEWAGTAGYSEAVYSVSAGLHTFKWEYDKDGSQSSGSDCGWIDFITFPSIEFNPEITTTSLPDWTVGFSYSQQLTATGGMGNMTWQDKNGDLAGTGLTLSSDGLLSG
ncbi:MAG: hypothetical protein GF404_00885, partial [candidate division Zixibacteria bacterium]|nr:hypothetical protein [candidate division Zixibacteria bacterium]